MKIIINENQVKFLTEDLSSLDDVSYGLKESIALWCLMNDFRFYIPNNVFGNKISLANSEHINREICLDIMKGTLTLANEERELFGYNDYDDFEDGDDEREEYMNDNNIYKVTTESQEYYIEVSNNISEHDGDIILQDYVDGELDDNDWYYDSIGWFYKIFR